MPITVEIYSPDGSELIARHDNVPASWTEDDILRRFGISKHLHVVRISDGNREVIQQGK